MRSSGFQPRKGKGRTPHIKSERFRKFSSVRQNLTTFVCREGSQRSGVEPRVLETEAPIHTVRSEFERHLFNIPLYVQETL